MKACTASPTCSTARLVDGLKTLVARLWGMSPSSSSMYSIAIIFAKFVLPNLPGCQMRARSLAVVCIVHCKTLTRLDCMKQTKRKEQLG